MPYTFRLAVLAAAALLVAVPAAAQTAPRELRVRMEQLGRALAEEAEGSTIIRFFPRHTPFVVERIPDPGGAAGPVLRRVLRPDSVRAYLKGTEVLCAFGGALQGTREGWRYVGRGRFTPRGRDTDTPRTVEWTRERGSWVVRRITEEYYIPRRVLGTPIDVISRDTTAFAWLPEERRYAAATEWYKSHRPVTIDDRRLVKYGLPRRLDRAELDRVGTFGVVPFFAEKGTAHAPGVVYALNGPDEYQPYRKDYTTWEDLCEEWW